MIAELIYFLVSVWLTWHVGNNLHRDGRHWIIDLLGDVRLADRINNVLLLGYRLVNIGYAMVTLVTHRSDQLSGVGSLESLCSKLGCILLVLAFLHYQNIGVLFLFSKLKSKYKWQL